MGRRRGHGEGSVYQRADGRWVGVADLGYADGRRRRKYVYGERQSDVIAELRKLNEQLANGLPPTDDRLTLDDLFERWYRDVLRRQVAPSAFENYRSIADRHIRPVLGRTRIAKLTSADVDALLSAKLDQGLSVSTVRRIRAILTQALGQAERWELVSRNVAAVTRGPRERRREGRTLTPAQVQTLLSALEGHRLRALYLLMLGTGLRRGEALGPALGRRRSRAGGARRAAGAQVREAGHQDRARPRRGEDSQESSRRQLAGAGRRRAPWAAGAPGGRPARRRRKLGRAGLGRWHPHELRHSAASLMLAQGVPIEVVSDVLGHSSIRMTADVYGHVLAPQRQAAAEAMAAILR